MWAPNAHSVWVAIVSLRPAGFKVEVPRHESADDLSLGALGRAGCIKTNSREDDLVQLRWPDFGGGANGPSLIEAQENYRRVGASDPTRVVRVRPATASEPMDSSWRPFEHGRDVIEKRVSGTDDGKTYAEDRTVYYYWRGATR